MGAGVLDEIAGEIKSRTLVQFSEKDQSITITMSKGKGGPKSWSFLLVIGKAPADSVTNAIAIILAGDPVLS